MNIENISRLQCPLRFKETFKNILKDLGYIDNSSYPVPSTYNTFSLNHIEKTYQLSHYSSQNQVNLCLFLNSLPIEIVLPHMKKLGTTPFYLVKQNTGLFLLEEKWVYFELDPEINYDNL